MTPSRSFHQLAQLEAFHVSSSSMAEPKVWSPVFTAPVFKISESKVCGSQDCSRNKCNTWKRCAARLSSSFPGIVKCTLAPQCMWRKKATVYGRTIFNYTWKLIIFGTSHFWEEHRQRRNVLIKNSNSPSNDFTWHSRMSKPWIRFHSHKLNQIGCTDHESPTLMQHQAGDRALQKLRACPPQRQMLAHLTASSRCCKLDSLAVWQYHESTAIKQPAALMLGVIAGTWCSVACCDILSARHNCAQDLHSRFTWFQLYRYLGLDEFTTFQPFRGSWQRWTSWSLRCSNIWILGSNHLLIQPQNKRAWPPPHVILKLSFEFEIIWCFDFRSLDDFGSCSKVADAEPRSWTSATTSLRRAQRFALETPDE